MTIIKILLTALLLSFSSAFAQPAAARPDISLRPGDRLPDVLTAPVFNAADARLRPGVRLAAYRGKLLLLDFWATWCSSCIANFPRLDSLERAYAGKLVVLGVSSKSTRDDEQQVRRFFSSSSARGIRYHLQTVVGDTLLDRLFPHRIVPHYVWIGTDGRVLTATSGLELTGTTVGDLLAGSAAGVVQKIDIDRRQPLLLADHPAVKQLAQYAILLQGPVEGLPRGNVFRKSQGIVNGRLMTNWPLSELFKLAAGNVFPGWNQKRFFVDGADSISAAAPWTLELQVPPAAADSLYREMLRELEHYTPGKLRMETRTRTCLVLSIADPALLQTSAGGKPANTLSRKQNPSFINQPLSRLAQWLDNREPSVEVIDGTLLVPPVDLRIPASYDNSREALTRLLAANGLALREEERQLTCYILDINH